MLADSLSQDTMSMQRTDNTAWQPEHHKDDKTRASTFKGFAKEITAHGVKYAVSEDSCRFRRIAWVLAVLGACIYLAVQLTALMIDFYSYPFTTATKVTPVSYIQFPTITICDINHLDASNLNNSEDVKTVFRVFAGGLWSGYHNKTIDDLRHEEPYKSILETKYMDYLQQTEPVYEHHFPYCFWAGSTVNCTDHLQSFNHPFGRCYKFNYNESEPKKTSRPGSKAGFSVVMKIKPDGYTSSENNGAGVKVLLHDIADWPAMSSKGVLFSPGFNYDIAFKKHTYQYLPYPYKSLGENRYCTESTPEGYGGKNGGYATSACVSSYSAMITTASCKCNVHNCTLDKYLSCYRPTLDRVYDEVTVDDSSGCATPCKTQAFEPIISQAFFPYPDATVAIKEKDPFLETDEDIRLSYLSLNLYFEDLIVRESEHVANYDNLSVLGTAGGHMGLFLGASILTVMELVDFICIKLWQTGRKLGCKYGLRVKDKSGPEIKSAQ